MAVLGESGIGRAVGNIVRMRKDYAISCWDTTGRGTFGEYREQFGNLSKNTDTKRSKKMCATRSGTRAGDNNGWKERILTKSSVRWWCVDIFVLSETTITTASAVVTNRQIIAASSAMRTKNITTQTMCRNWSCLV